MSAIISGEPHRSATGMSNVSSPGRRGTNASILSDDAIPEVDPNTTNGLLADRIDAWRNVVTYLEEYIMAIEKAQRNLAKDYEHALKTVSSPLKHGDNFDQSTAGVAGFLENIRSNTQALITNSADAGKSIKGSVLPMLERVARELKAKSKELGHDAGKGVKVVEKARNATQKHIELLGQNSASFDSSGGQVTATDDPYVLCRGVWHRLHHQVLSENNYRNDLLAVQTTFASFEAHVIGVIQQAMAAFIKLVAGQSDSSRALFSDMLACVNRLPPDAEWRGFVKRSGDRLMDPNEPPRNVESISFPNMNHAATKPLIEGSLERKSRNKLSFGYHSAYYVVTPSRYLHAFKDSDDARHDPKPELSIYLPDSVIGAPFENKFNIKGKDKSKSIGSKLTGSPELAFKAHTPIDAQRWFDVIKGVCGATGPAEPDDDLVAEDVPPAYASDLSTSAVAPGVVPVAVGAVTDPIYAPVAAPSQTHAQTSPPNPIYAPARGSIIVPTSAEPGPTTAHADALRMNVPLDISSGADDVGGSTRTALETNPVKPAIH